MFILVSLYCFSLTEDKSSLTRNTKKGSSDVQSLLSLICVSNSLGFLFLSPDSMGHHIDPSWWTYWAISHFSPCSMTGVTKTIVCTILSVG